MKCKFPWKQYWNGEYTPNGKKLLRPYRMNDEDEEILVPCGRCSACRVNYGAQWALRCLCEAKEHSENYFLTMTIDDDHVRDRSGNVGKDNLEYVPTVNADDISKFMKALRQKQKRHYDIDGIRFLACTEYGDISFRPHCHMILFGAHLDDLKPYGKSSGYWIFTSKYLDSIWEQGTVFVGEVSADSAQYVAKYAVKNTDKYRELCDKLNVDYPSLRMSRNPGIGKHYFDTHRNSLLENDGVYIDGKKIPLPKYWKNIDVKIRSPDEYITNFVNSLDWTEENILKADDHYFLDEAERYADVKRKANEEQKRFHNVPDPDDLRLLGIRKLADDQHARDKI